MTIGQRAAAHVQCPGCRAAIGRPCLSRTGKQNARPHAVRVDAAVVEWRRLRNDLRRAAVRPDTTVRVNAARLLNLAELPPSPDIPPEAFRQAIAVLRCLPEPAGCRVPLLARAGFDNWLAISLAGADLATDPHVLIRFDWRHGPQYVYMHAPRPDGSRRIENLESGTAAAAALRALIDLRDPTFPGVPE